MQRVRLPTSLQLSCSLAVTQRHYRGVTLFVFNYVTLRTLVG